MTKRGAKQRSRKDAEPAAFDEPAILFRINQLFRPEMTDAELYEATRKDWKIRPERVKHVRIACAVYEGIIQEVYEVREWLPSPETAGRLLFIGAVAEPAKRTKYLGKSATHVWKWGNINPVGIVGM